MLEKLSEYASESWFWLLLWWWRGRGGAAVTTHDKSADSQVEAELMFLLYKHGSG